MKTIRTLLALGFSFAAAHAGTFSTTPWTNDATSGIVAGQTNWAYHFGSTATATVNTVPVTGIATIASIASAPNANFDLVADTPAVINSHTNFLTALTATDPGSAVMANSFVYSNASGGVMTVTVKRLTPGATYMVSFFSVGWDDTGTRPLTFGSGSDSGSVNQNQFDKNKGIRVDYAFTAEAVGEKVITITPGDPSRRFHLYGLALRQTSDEGSFVVNNTFDSGNGSLRQALANAAANLGAETVTFAPALSGQTITLTSEIVFAIAAIVRVDASALAGGVTLSGGGTNRIFSVSNGSFLELVSLTLTDGDGTGTASTGSGGAIFSTGNVDAIDCTFSANRAGNQGGAFANGANGFANFTRCTFSGNQQTGAGGQGGGAINHAATATSMSLTHCTLAGNSSAGSQGGGAIRNRGVGTLTLSYCLIAGNTVSGTGTGADVNSTAAVVLSGANLIQTAIAGGGTFTGSTAALINKPAALGPLASNGGPTQTRALLVGSAGINAATGSPAMIDQRGFTVAGTPDLGAYESGGGIIVITNADSGVGSLRQAIADAAASPGADTITFAPALNGQTITLTSNELVVASDVTIDASSLTNGLTISGNNERRIFYVSSGTVVLSRLNLQGGFDGVGGGISNLGTLTVSQSTLSGNSADNTEGGFNGAGGGIYNSGTLTLTQSTLSGNSADIIGGGIYNLGTLTVSQSTLSGNSADSTEGGGGGICNFGTLTVNQSTLSGNSAYKTKGGGIYNVGTLTVTNSLIAGNTATLGGVSDVDNFTSITATGVNLIGDLAGSRLTDNANVNVGAPLLAPLGNYGGPTQTMALLPGSPARNAGGTSSFTTDQRGFPITGTPDIGAYEAGTFTNYNAWIYETLPTSTPYAWNDPVPDAQHASTFDADGDGVTNGNEWIARTAPGNAADHLRITGTALTGGNLTFTFPSVSGRSYTLWQSDTLSGAWTNTTQPAITGNGNPRTFTVPAPAPGIPKRFYRVQVEP